MSNGGILIVDDNPTNMKLVAFLLASRGHEVRTAASAVEALSAIEERLPRLILMDLQLPGMDGLALTRKLRAEQRTADIVIVAVTAYAMAGDEKTALAAGCDGYVTKPIDTRTLPGRIAEHLSRGRRQEAR